MNSSEVKLPSNKKFGFFFALVFVIATGYFYTNSSLIWAYISSVTALIFFIVAVVKADLLLPLNKLWMRFGLLLGMIVSPIVLGAMFFGIFTPIAIFMRLRGRDELRLKFKAKISHWISRDKQFQANSFKNQY